MQVACAAKVGLSVLPARRSMGKDKNPYGTAVLLQGQCAEAAQVFGEHDGVTGVFVLARVLVDIGEHHGLAAFQHDAANAVTGQKGDAGNALAGCPAEVRPFHGGADEGGKPYSHKVEAVGFGDAVGLFLIIGITSAKYRFGKVRLFIQSAHADPPSWWVHFSSAPYAQNKKASTVSMLASYSVAESWGFEPQIRFWRILA